MPVLQFVQLAPFGNEDSDDQHEILLFTDLQIALEVMLMAIFDVSSEIGLNINALDFRYGYGTRTRIDVVAEIKRGNEMFNSGVDVSNQEEAGLFAGQGRAFKRQRNFTKRWA